MQIIFFGSPLIDMTISVDNNFLEKYNLQTDNAYVIDESNRMIFDEIRTKARVDVGGSVTNTARIVQKLTKSQNLIYFGTIGNDCFGEIIKQQLSQENLGANLIQVEGNTGRVAVLLKDKARTLVTDLGVSRIFTLNDNILNKIQKSALIYFSGFFISVSFPTISYITTNFKNIAINLGAPFLSTKFPKELTNLYKNSSLIFGNESEFRSFGKIHNFQYDNLVDVIQATNRLLDGISRVVVVTRGGGSVLVIRDSNWQEFQVPPLEIDLIDTNGAGDAFVGGFLARFSNNYKIEDCVMCGIETARKVIQNKNV